MMRLRCHGQISALFVASVLLAACGDDPAVPPVTDAGSDAAALDGGPRDSGADAGDFDAGDTDAGVTDAGDFDAGDTDAGDFDAGDFDAGGADGGPTDAGPTDAGPTDAGPTDAGPTDAGPTDAGGADAGPTDAGPTDAGPADAGGADAGPIDAGAPDAGVVTLTVENYLAWCTVTVGSGAPSTAGVQTLRVAPGTVVSLDAAPLGPFVWAYWFGTAGDTTAAHDTSMMTTVTVDADTTVQACCPFAASPTCPPP